MNKNTDEIDFINSLIGSRLQNNLGDYISSKQASDVLNEKKFTVSDTDITYRILNHWCDLGLIRDSRESDSSWRKLNAIDLIWIKVLQELRVFGVGLEKIKLAKDSIFRKSLQGKDLPILEIHLLHALQGKEVMFLMIGSGRSTILLLPEFIGLQEFLGSNSYLVVSITSIVRNTFHRFGIKEDLTVTNISLDEAQTLEFIRQGNYQEIKIILSNGKIERLEGKEIESKEEEIKKILSKASYQKVEILQKDGRIVNIARTEQKKLKSME